MLFADNGVQGPFAASQTEKGYVANQVEHRFLLFSPRVAPGDTVEIPSRQHGKNERNGVPTGEKAGDNEKGAKNFREDGKKEGERPAQAKGIGE